MLSETVHLQHVVRVKKPLHMLHFIQVLISNHLEK